MTEWIVQATIETARPLDEQRLAALAQAAEETRNGPVARRSDGPGYVVIVDVTDEDPVAAAQAGARFARDELGVDSPGTVVDLQVSTPERFEAEALRPDFPPLASAADAAEILGVSRQRVHQLAASNTRFPAPVARVATGPLGGARDRTLRPGLGPAAWPAPGRCDGPAAETGGDDSPRHRHRRRPVAPAPRWNALRATCACGRRGRRGVLSGGEGTYL